jgi:signal transduction histidine kinase
VPAPLPSLWRARSRRAVAIPVLLGGAALAGLVALDPALPWSGRTPAVNAAALLLALLLSAVAAVFWQGERETARVRRALAAGISHDMRTPLAQIRMFTEMLLMGRERSLEERSHWLEAIEREAHRLGDVMENLLLFIHGEEPNPYPARQPTDLGALIEDVAVGFASRAAARRTHLVADPPAGHLALLDGRAFRQAVGNLLDNALRYGPAGQTITVSLETTGTHQALITVADQGPGVLPGDRKRVWQPFVRLDEGAAAEGGSGLGLAVVRQVVEAHGGQVWIADPSDEGARVCVSLPLLPAPEPRPPSPADAPPADRLLPLR